MSEKDLAIKIIELVGGQKILFLLSTVQQD